MGMSKPAKSIRRMWEVLFVPGYEIERSGKNIKRQVAVGRKEDLLTVVGKAIDRHRLDAGLKKQLVRAKLERVRERLFGIVEARPGCFGKVPGIVGDADCRRVIKKLFADKLNDIAQPWGDMGTE